MHRAVLILIGLGLFGMGLFLGMISSFTRTLPADLSRMSAPAPSTAVVPGKVAQHKPQTGEEKKPTPASVEAEAINSELTEALISLANAMAKQSSANQPPAPTQPEQQPQQPVPAMPDVALLQELVAAAVTERLAAGEAAPPNPAAGRWVFDPRVGWLWLPENSAQVLIVPSIEVYPGSIITTRTGDQRSKEHPKSFPDKKQPAKPQSSVIAHDNPGSTRLPASYPVTKP
jgi:hypothetical protein